jgi:hypothetical protein
MSYTWGKTEMSTKFWSRNLNEKGPTGKKEMDLTGTGCELDSDTSE